jgi:SAM-dependent methyltransferase
MYSKIGKVFLRTAALERDYEMNERMWQVFFEIHDGLLREGPGSERSTLEALELIPEPGESPRILDLGCGPGAQAVLLARETGGRVIAVDNHRPFLETVASRAVAAGVGERVQPLLADMSDPGLAAGAFDLIWSEGALYQMGFDNALGACRELLKPGGHLAATEAVWLRDDPPAEVRRCWEIEYPAITDVAGNAALIRRAGYEIVGGFTLPERDWWDEYYGPLEDRLPRFAEEYVGDPEAMRAVESTREEIDVYRRFSDYYGYRFFVMRRPQ